MTAPDSRSNSTSVLVTAAWFTGMGWSIAIAIALGVFAGNWLDGQTGSHPLFL
ncbi:MAG: AtpZ/AtpI family protein, partial [Dehalococcoidia bacterium]